MRGCWSAPRPRLDLTGMTLAAQRQLAARRGRAASRQFVARRLKHEPVARILGEKEFWGLRFRSPPTRWCRARTPRRWWRPRSNWCAHRGDPPEPMRIADIGTGSGAILLALLHELPDATGIGTDISAGALRTAKANAEQLGLGARATFVECDYCEKLDRHVRPDRLESALHRARRDRRARARGARLRSAARAGRRQRRARRLPRHGARHRSVCSIRAARSRSRWDAARPTTSPN